MVPAAVAALMALALGVAESAVAAAAADAAREAVGVEVEEVTSGTPDAARPGRLVRIEQTIGSFAGQSKPDTIGLAAPPRKVSHKLTARLAVDARAAERVEVLVTFVEDRPVPQFPSVDPAQPRTAAVNVTALARSDAMVHDITARREPEYRRLRGEIERLGGTVLETFWLAKGMHVTLPLSAVPALAQRADVQYVEPAIGGELPPDNTERKARELLGTDPFFTTGRTGDRIAILDTGVRASHLILSGMIASGQDFTGENDTFTDSCNHGTSTAAVISANGNLGDAYRGITAIPLKVYKIYPNKATPTNIACGLNTNAAVQAFQSAVQQLEKVIVAEIQSRETFGGAIGSNADAAFDAGAVVISAAGNFGTSAGSVTSPGSSRKVLGIGAVDVENADPYDKQGRGPTPDGRYKPDLVAPHNVDTAVPSSELTGIYGGTSAATAQAGGTAAVFRHFVRKNSTDVEPGHVYAGLILGGGRPSDFNNIEGAGKLKLAPPPPDGFYTKLKQTNTPGSQIGTTLSLNFTATSCRLSASLWWPEQAGVHNDYDVTITDPQGNVRASSTSAVSVFELARVSGPLQQGIWKVSVKPFRPVVGTATVYMAISLCR